MIRAIKRRRERRAAARAAHHRNAQLVSATDMAITAAVRAQLAEPVVDLSITIPMRVTTGDVQAAAREHFGLDVVLEEAAAALRHRLEFRGHARWPDLITDAYDHQP